MIIKHSTKIIVMILVGQSSHLLMMIICSIIPLNEGSPLTSSPDANPMPESSTPPIGAGNATFKQEAGDNSASFSSRASFVTGSGGESFNDSTSTYAHNNQSAPEAAESNLRQQYTNHRTNESSLDYHSNHQSYPAEPYPSASYTSLTGSLPGAATGSFQANNQLPATTLQNPLFTRDHHQSAASFAYPQHQAAENTGYSDYNFNHNYDNTGLIQNLSSSLFPVKQLNNATLQTLSELLNRTKQAAAAAASNPYKSAYSNNLASYNNNNYFGPSHYPTPTTSPSSYPTLSDSSDQYNILDYIRPNGFGFREPSSVSRHQHQGPFYPKSPPSSYSHNNRPPASQNFHPNHQYNSQQQSGNYYDNYQPSGFKTASNIYNTYMPYKESLNSMPTMTNGQTLAMAIYDNLLDNGYRLPSLLMSNKQPGGSSSAGFAPTSGAQAKYPPASGYQYVQQANLNNQNVLDRVTYHSTPFRPSIANPPPPTSSAAQPTTPASSPASPTAGGSESSAAPRQQRPRTEADNKSVSFASLSSSSSAVSSDSKPEQGYSTNGQAITGNRFASAASMRQSSNNKDKSAPEGELVETNPSKAANSSGGYEQLESGNAKEASSQNKSPLNSSSLASGQSMLLDLYEREIDNQIREALYGDALHNSADQLMSLTSRPQQTSLSWPASLYEDSLAEQTLASWLRPAASRPAGSSYLGQATKLRPTTLAGSSLGLHTDPLTAALQELPTFSASDLQPMYPGGSGSVYSPLPAASSDILTSALADSSSLSSLNSQLLASLQQSQLSNYHVNKLTTASKPASGKKPASGFGGSPQATGSSAYLPTILLKLHSSPLSSILSNPLNHFYSSKHRDKKRPSASQSSQSSQQQLSSPTSPLGGKNLLNSLFQPTHSQLAATGDNQKNRFENQQAALAAAAATASLIAAATAAAEENSLSPLQAALLQTSNLVQPQLDQSSLLAALDQAVSASRPAASSLLAPATSGGGANSPLIWRNVLSPWTRKQTNSGQNNNNNINSPAQTLYGSHNKLVSPLSSLVGAGSGAYLFNSPPPAASTTQAQLSNLPAAKKPAKLKIRILKIPVAFYDQPAGQTTLLPAQMQPSSLAASLLASVSCPLAHASPQLPHTLDQHLLRQHQQSFAGLLPGAVSASTGSLGLQSTAQSAGAIGAAASSAANASAEAPANQFTDINQPNDLQVSPTSLQAKLIKTLR